MAPWRWYFLAILFFFLDSLCFAFFEQQIVFSLLSFYISSVVQPQVSLIALGVANLLLMLQSFVYYGLATPLLILTVPLAVIGSIAQKYLHAYKPLRSVLTIISLVVYCLGISMLIFDSSHTTSYTCSIIFVNLILMILIP